MGLPRMVRCALARWLLKAEGRIENAQLDKLLGLDVLSTSRHLGAVLAENPPEEWRGEYVWQEPGETGHPMTGYSDLIALLRHLQLSRGSTFAELGSGFGRAGLVIGLLYPEVHYLGYELLAPRVEAALRAHKLLNLGRRVNFQTLHMGEWQPDVGEAADVYYVFCSFCEPTGRHVLEQLKRLAAHKPFRLVLNLGMQGFDPEENPWLEALGEVGIFTLYKSRL